MFNQIITQFGIPKDTITYHGSHIHNNTLAELDLNFGFEKDHSSYYYPQVSGQIEVLNKSITTILKKTIRQSKSNLHIMLYPALWAYQTAINTSMSFSPY